MSDAVMGHNMGHNRVTHDEGSTKKISKANYGHRQKNEQLTLVLMGKNAIL